MEINKTHLKNRYDKLVWLSKNLEEGNIRNVPEAMVKRSDEAKELLKIIRKGCGNIIDIEGDCMYVSFQGTKRYCTTCRKRIRFLEGVLK